MADQHVVAPDDFKAALGCWASGVTVVTTRDEGWVYGITVSAFSSLSLDPTLVLVCLADSNRLPRMIEKTGKFAVSILAEGQETISNWFAVSGREPVERFEDFGTIELHTGSPIIDGSIAHLDCLLERSVDGGDHTIVIGRVIAAASDPAKKPLVFYRRGYRPIVLE
jgi:3-hydroxy-9,10-secoandrosta-1,3,5(10)-triene-9,17-dione monooxygenase reductase component